MMYPREFIDIAHRAAVWSELRKRCSALLAGMADGRTLIISEEVPYREHRASERAVLEVLRDVIENEMRLRRELGRFECVRRATLGGALAEPRKGAR